MTELKYVGRRSRPEDGLEKVTGKARYVGDYYLPGMLYARVLRSPLPHARIVKLDAGPALQVPGVLAVITAADFVNHSNLGWPLKDAYALAWQKVRHVGDPVAAVAAESEKSARAGLQAILVEYEALPVVGDIHHALDPDAPIIPDTKEPGTGNLTNTHLVRFGDPDPILENSEVVLEETYFFKHQEHAYLETEGALAIPEPDGGLTVYANDQSPFINRDNLVMLLGLPTEKVRVIQAYVGGSFGGKDDIGYQTSAQAGALALKAGRPVRLVLTRTESFLASYRREAMEVKIKLGASKDGELTAARVNLLADSGGYASMTPLSSWRASVHAAGAYRYRAVHVDTKSVYTNNGYSGAMRGFGNTQGIGGIEQAVDELAFRLNMDPLDFRLKNCLTTGDIAMTGNPVNQSVHLAECLRLVRQRSDWDRKRAQYASGQKGRMRRGIGVACYFHGSSLGGEGADYATTTLKIEEDDSITLTSGLTDYGQGSRTVFMLIAAEELGVDVERIRIMRPDTQTGIESGPTVASRSTMIGGNATRVAAQRLNQVLYWAAARTLKCQPNQITRHGELFYAPDEESLTFTEVTSLARQMGLSLYVQGKWQMPIFTWDFERGTGVPYHCYTFGAQVAEVEVNLESGTTKVLGVWAAHDGGRIVFPGGAFGQMYGGVAMGIGYALTEHISYHEGYPQALNLHDYHIPRATDIPPIDGNFIQYDYEDGPFGALNLAEPMMISTAPAIANAVFQATGKRWRTFPLTAQVILSGRDDPARDTAAACRKGLGLLA
ncbi:MAG TPA: xanthine dehydrogenase family protein molybdopterin-binding subunit [Anaerolineales bacterium]|nr:xanthine dehydrogenase family protein molybdopterin-binding subunit [Anaerolineales bacterium]